MTIKPKTFKELERWIDRQFSILEYRLFGDLSSLGSVIVFETPMARNSHIYEMFMAGHLHPQTFLYATQARLVK